MAEWVEPNPKHPRYRRPDKRAGKFRPKAAGVVVPKQRAAAASAAVPKQRAAPAAAKADPPLGEVRGRLQAASLDQLLDAFSAISAGPPAGRDRALRELDAELARREGTAALTVRDDHQSRQLDALVDRGWQYHEAYAEVHHLDVTQLDREARMQLVDAERRPGERRDATIRRMYAETVYLQYMQAEESTRGNVLNRAGRSRGIDPVTLWSGPAARARKYAAPELLAWWEANGGRRNFAEYRAQFSGDRAAAAAARQAGAGRDYGV